MFLGVWNFSHSRAFTNSLIVAVADGIEHERPTEIPEVDWVEREDVTPVEAAYSVYFPALPALPLQRSAGYFLALSSNVRTS